MTRNTARTHATSDEPAANAPESSPAASWPAMNIERRAIGGLVPYARNARLHSDAQIAQLAASMREWGWTQPILVDENDTIIAGHGRVLAGLKLGLDEVPVMVARGWSDAKIRAYVIADNRLAENATWDREMLGAEMAELRDAFDLSLMGFTSGEIDALTLTDLPPFAPSVDENVAAGIKMITCPACGHEFPK
ncbi:ParB/Srx family N-terminal domain-containing protein [Paraburkholderia youngii]|uniref:ParB/Srx family N-terminal domain-containing protein n=1 Tax=Paraburkholderia youngii TaxID=2782701 RepID=UPI003D242244